MKPKSHLDRYNLIKLFLKLMLVGIVLILTGYYLAGFNEESLTNSWQTILVILGCILCIPISLYGTFTSAIFWRDHMDKNEGNGWLVLIIASSIIEVSEFSIGYLFGLFFFLRHTLPGYRRLSKQKN